MVIVADVISAGNWGYLASIVLGVSRLCRFGDSTLSATDRAVGAWHTNDPTKGAGAFSESTCLLPW
jgi:hypothetical protein